MGLASLGSPSTWQNTQQTWRIENIPSALQCWSTDEDQAGYGEGSRLRGGEQATGVGADREEVGGLADGLVLTGALWVRPGCGAPTVGQQSLSRSHWPGCSGSPRGSWLGGWAPSSVTPRCHLQEDPVIGSRLGTLDLESRQGGTQPGQGS